MTMLDEAKAKAAATYNALTAEIEALRAAIAACEGKEVTHE